MTINDVIRKVNIAMDEAEGTPDYDNKLNDLIDSIQREIAAIGKMIKKNKYVTSENNLIVLPDDMLEVIKVMTDEFEQIPYVILDKKTIRIANDDGDYILFYYAYPERIDSNTNRNTELEVDLDCQEALVYGVCSGLCINDEPELYAIYRNRYDTLIANIQTRIEQNTTASISGGIRL